MSDEEPMIQVRDQYYILATSALADDRTRVLKQGDTFAIFDRHGDIHQTGAGQQGVFDGDTRMLSRIELRLGSVRPLLLSSTVTSDNTMLAVDLSNPDVDREQQSVPRDTIHIFRATCLWNRQCHMRLRVRNYGADPVSLTLALRFEADFADIFEVRGTKRAERGTLLEPVVGADSVELRYRGLDRRERSTRLELDPAPSLLSSSLARWQLELEPGEERTLRATALFDATVETVRHPSFEAAHELAARALEQSAARACHIATSHDQFNSWLDRSSADLRMLITDTPNGPYPYAGVPWFSTVFGRDGLITALQTLWVDPQIAAGVLRFLAANQAHEVDPARDAEPGKILHELRSGEMSALREVPFGRYYGSVDATPLFIMLAAAYFETSGDLSLVREIWPQVLLALEWIERHGDRDGDGYVEYARRTESGLHNQGWKDANDSVFHADGTLAHGPIALCEVQAYVHGAWQGVALLAAALGQHELAARATRCAQALAERFERDFWCEEIGSYALALDGDKRQCQVRTSNAGHVLFTGTATPTHARAVRETLFAPDSFSGWGVRTVSARERRFNPMGYHNGTVWPHDNALIAAGMARYGMREPALEILGGLFGASLSFDLHRMPELFCGFPRRPGEGPTHYPVACAPQAWASGAVYMLLQACLGLRIDGRARRIELVRPELPPFIEYLGISNLRVGDARADLELRRHAWDIGVNVRRHHDGVEVVVIK